MAPVTVDPAKVRTFADAEAFALWLAQHHDSADEVWIRIFKKGSGMASIGPREAVEVVLCWGWIDGIRKRFDERSFVQRYTPRRAKSIWSQVNRDAVERLEREGRMTEHGRRQVELAKADGRWDAAYAPATAARLPEDLLAAIAAEPRAQATLETLSAQNRYALAFRLGNLKTARGRQARIAAFVQMLAEGRTPHPQGKGAGR